MPRSDDIIPPPPIASKWSCHRSPLWAFDGLAGLYSVSADWRWLKETWTLGMTGNWNAHSIGNNACGNNVLSETGTFNKVNEWTGRSRTTPSASPTIDTLTYDAVGNMITDGKGQKYLYDGFGRLREVQLTAESNRLKSAYLRCYPEPEPPLLTSKPPDSQAPWHLNYG